MRHSIVTVRADWDADAEVYVATSDDVPGLVTEAETVDLLIAKIHMMVPELLQLNGILSVDEFDVPIDFITRVQSEVHRAA